jgi:signal transduction histidine kinase/CheY-like chemotaxis protein/HPt (histidine-containing phosphotransfer) domain-containing protein
MSSPEFPSSPARRLNLLYITSLSVVAIVSVAGNLFVDRAIRSQAPYSQAINIAGRQRMLSQKLSKNALAVEVSRTTDREIPTDLDGFQTALDQFRQAHQGLQQGDPQLRLQGNPSDRIRQAFNEVEPDYQVLVQSAQELIDLLARSPATTTDEQVIALVRQILDREDDFLAGMETIVALYEGEARSQLAQLQQLQNLLLGVILYVLLLEAFAIFRPTVRQLRNYIDESIEARERSAEQLSELEESNERLDNALQVAYSATRLKSEFLANISHELRTPMNAVMGMTRLLLDTPLNPEQQDLTETILDSSETLLATIEDLLDLSELEAGRTVLNLQPCDLRQCVEKTLALVAPEAARKSLNLAYQMDETTPRVAIADVRRLQQILLNLLGNAIKFTEVGEVSVSITAEEMGNWSWSAGHLLAQLARPEKSSAEAENPTYYEIHFAVKDTGIGIPPEKTHRLFRSFSQVDGSTTRSHGGTGLGLAISKRLSELMGGRMWVESEVGVGSTFGFAIAVPEVQKSPQVYERGEDPRLAGKTIALLVSNTTNREILRDRATGWGMNVRVATSAAEVDRGLEGGDRLDGAIVEVGPETSNGEALWRQLQQQQPDLPLLLLGFPSQLDGKLAGDTLFPLYKPLGLESSYWALVGAIAREKVPVDRRAPSKDSPTPQFDPKVAAAIGDLSVRRLDAEFARRVPLRILVAEDNAVNRKVVLKLLERLGYEADAVGDGVEAVEAVKKDAYDAILMDVQMPRMSGIEATRAIVREFDGDRRPRIIALTAGAMEGDRAQCLAAGMDDYLSKPVRVEALQTALERLLLPVGQETLDVTVPPSSAPSSRSPSVEVLPEAIAPSYIPTVDLKRLTRLRYELQAPGEPDVVTELIEMFLEDTMPLLKNIREALEQNNPEALKEAAHTLKGSSGNLGAVALSGMCKTIQLKAAEGYLEGIQEDITNLETEFLRVKKVLETQKIES